MNKPKVNSEGQKELDRAADQFEQFADRLSQFNPCEVKAPIQETESQTRLSQREVRKNGPLHIEPLKTMTRNKTFWDEKNRAHRDYDWERVTVIVENKEIIGEAVEAWTGKWGCDPCHYWKVPVNKPVSIPRHLAAQLRRCKYHRMSMQESAVTSSDGMGTYMGAMIADQTLNRIDCREVGNSFGNASSF